jgi:hypothetical protein
VPEVCLRQRENHSDEAEKVNGRKNWREHLKKGGKIKKNGGKNIKKQFPAENIY